MPAEPTLKRTIAFVDGQNLFYAAKKAYGYPYPNYDPKKLAEYIASAHGWTLVETFFYTGIPDRTDNPFWNHFWTAKLACAFPISPTAENRRGINSTEISPFCLFTFDFYLSCRLLPSLLFCPILRGTNFGLVSRSGHVFVSTSSPGLVSPAGPFVPMV